MVDRRRRSPSRASRPGIDTALDRDPADRGRVGAEDAADAAAGDHRTCSTQDYADISTKLLTLKTGGGRPAQLLAVRGLADGDLGRHDQADGDGDGRRGGELVQRRRHERRARGGLAAERRRRRLAVRHALRRQRHLRVDRDQAHRPHDVDGRSRRLRGRLHDHAGRDPGRTGARRRASRSPTRARSTTSRTGCRAS